MLPVIALTPGEPAGIGPDIALQISQQAINSRLVFFADKNLLQQRAQQLDLKLVINCLDNIEQAEPHQAGSLQVLHIALAEQAQAGVLNKMNAGYVLECLKQSVNLIQQKKVDALVTGPIHKGIINDSGIAFTGHTEFLAQITNGTPVMMLAADNLRVALVTTHLPLSEAVKQ